MTEPTTVDDVITSAEHGIGRITLDRPKAMNALTRPMVARVHDALERWRDDDTVRVVVIDGSGERGLCAGGDIKMFHASALADGEEARDFFRAEYRMNAAIASYPKPVVALMFGAVFGGGVGISAHAGHRLVAEGASVGMPEVGIGFIPDVGGTWLLGRTPGELGLYAALTGAPLTPPDAVRCGLADAVVSAETLAAVRAAEDDFTLLALVTSVVADADRTGAGGVLADRQAWIDECFAAPDVPAILARLRQVAEPGTADAAAAAELIATRSPEAVVLTLLTIRRGRTLPTLEAALDLEYAVAAASPDRPDFAEGIRAQVIDKDRNPHWQPASFDDVDVAALSAAIDAWAEAPVPGAPSRKDDR